eukprot:TRINITY_DN24591_c0_g1_i1.p1 TRINITY_DN24591_c0_g1~~TRINITY_DN24591_c0_g1_i1.p1  ORF type:complete len:574 (+),score=86.65 TRINITY_DN24591_c0_g1_i1:41-1762(+)
MMHGNSMGISDAMGMGLHPSGITSMGVSSMQQPVGLGGLLELLQGAGPGGMVQVQCSLLYNTVVTLVKTVAEHNAVIGSLTKNLEELKESVTSLPTATTLKNLASKIDDALPRLEVAIPRLEGDIKNVSRDIDAVSRNSVPLNDPTMQQVVNSISSRLQSLEVRQEDFAKEKSRIDAIESTVKLVSSTVTQEAGALQSVTQETSALRSLVNQMSATPATPKQQKEASQVLSPPLKSSIQEMLNTCQSLAGKQSETVNVVTQSCGRLDQLEVAMGKIHELYPPIAPVTKAVQELYSLLDLPLDLSPYLETSDQRLKFLHSRPAFQTLLSRMEKLERAPPPPSINDVVTPRRRITDGREPRWDSHAFHQPLVDDINVSPTRQRNPFFHNTDLQMSQLSRLAGPAAVSPIPELPTNRSTLEAADKLVAALAQALADKKERGGNSGGVSPVRVNSPHAREFKVHQQLRSTSTSTMAGEGSDWLMLGMEVIDDDGVKVSRTQPDGPAAVGGLRPGDSLVSFNGVALNTRADLLRCLAKAHTSQLIPIIFVPQNAPSPVATHIVIGRLPAPNSNEVLQA